ncbi:unnamed protein product, partial [Menidia menidia]
TILLAAVAILSLALMISLCINVKLCIKQQAMLRRAHLRLKVITFMASIMKSSKKILMIIRSSRKIQSMETLPQRDKPSEPDLNYASLDLKIAKKRKMKNRHQQGHLQGRNKPQEQPSSPANAFSEMDVDVDAHLPSKDINTMVSHSSIYLNSQQIAQETEELEMEMGREREREGEGGSRDWEGDGESQERMERDDSCTGNAKLTESENSPNCSDHF